MRDYVNKLFSTILSKNLRTLWTKFINIYSDNLLDRYIETFYLALIFPSSGDQIYYSVIVTKIKIQPWITPYQSSLSFFLQSEIRVFSLNSWYPRSKTIKLIKNCRNWLDDDSIIKFILGCLYDSTTKLCSLVPMIAQWSASWRNSAPIKPRFVICFPVSGLSNKSLFLILRSYWIFGFFRISSIFLK